MLLTITVNWKRRKGHDEISFKRLTTISVLNSLKYPKWIEYCVFRDCAEIPRLKTKRAKLSQRRSCSAMGSPSWSSTPWPLWNFRGRSLRSGRSAGCSPSPPSGQRPPNSSCGRLRKRYNEQVVSLLSLAALKVQWGIEEWGVRSPLGADCSRDLVRGPKTVHVGDRAKGMMNSI